MVHSHDFYALYQKTYTKYTDLYGQVCVFLQKGSFYEIYGQQNPKTQVDLNTGREIMERLALKINIYPDDAPGGMTGFYGGVPIYTLDKWASKLIELGYSVVIIDEFKNGAGLVSKREVTRVLSKGTHVEGAESSKSFLLTSLWLETSLSQPPTFGVASADLTTGQVYLYEGNATGKPELWHTDDLRHFFQVHPPKELLLHVRGLPLQETEESLRRTLYIPNAPIHIKTANPEQQCAFEKTTIREEFLREMFQPTTALPLRTWLRCEADGSSLQERALVALLRFAEDHCPKLAQMLQAPKVWHPTQNLQIINNALTQLNLIGPVGQTSVEDLFCNPYTAMGKRSLSSRLCTPLADSHKIRQRQKELEWILSSSPTNQKEMEHALSSIYDLSRLHRLIVRGSIKASDVIQLHQSYQAAFLLHSILKKSPLVGSCSIDLKACTEKFSQLFDVEKATSAQETPDELGFLLGPIGPKSAEAELKIAEIYAEANTWLTTLATKCGISRDSLQFKPTEKNMFCVHLTRTTMKAMEKKIDSSEGYVFKALASSGRIEHPSLDGFQQRLDSAKALLNRCMLIEVSNACISFAQETRQSWQSLEEWITNVDLALSMAKTAMQQGWVQPIIEDGSSSGVKIENLRHPLIENQKRQSKYVTHNVSLGYDEQEGQEGQGWLLYGMNASGKSSLMKAIGLAVLLAQVGSYVPATSMTLRPFQRLATRILNQDNLWAGLSSFAVEMSELREILAVADNRTLVLGDELCAGTESISGTAIVAAGICHLYKCNSRFVLATHLHDLMKLEKIKALEQEHLRVWHLHVEYDLVRDILVYDRRLCPGSGSSMYGLEVAKALHLPKDMIEEAFAMRRILLGESAPEDAKPSSWNKDLVRKACSACKKTIEKELEVHHLQERAAAKNGRNEDGTALNHLRNLATLCQTCHDKHHAGVLHIGPVEDTSEGPKRQILDFSKYEHSPETPRTQGKSKCIGFTAEEIQKIKEILQQTPGLTPKLYSFKIRHDAGIEITDAQFRNLKTKGVF
jgi:DNA mismatch repair protein MutS